MGVWEIISRGSLSWSSSSAAGFEEKGAVRVDSPADSRDTVDFLVELEPIWSSPERTVASNSSSFGSVLRLFAGFLDLFGHSSGWEWT
jgi:hypothetical protein